MLRINNRDITMLRATVAGFSPEARSKDIARRVNEIVKASQSVPLVTAKTTSEGSAFYLGTQFAFSIVYEDLDEPTGETLEQASTQTQKRLETAVREMFEQRDVPRLIWNALWACVATIGLLAFVVLVNRIRLHICRNFQRPSTTRLPEAPRDSLLPSFIRQALSVIFNLLALAVEFTAVNFWLTFILRKFPYTRPWGESLQRNIAGLLLRAGLAILRALPGLAMVGVVILVCILLTRATNRFFYRIKSREVSVLFIHPEVVPPTRRLIVAAIWLFGLVIAYPNLPGSQTEAFKGVSVLLGLLVTLGSSGIFGQAMCGILLMYSRAYKIGDYIRIEETEGTVVAIGALSTKLRTIKNEVVNIPNTVVVSKQTRNFSSLQSDEGVIIHTEVTIGYPAPWRQVEAMLLMAAARTAGLKRNPAPFVLQMALGDYAVRYQLNVFLDRAEQQVPLLASLHSNIQDVFNEFGVQIMTPHYRRDPAEPQVVPKERWFEPPAEPVQQPPEATGRAA